jgi:predicted DNA-binding mobile mystery protein A
MKHPNSLRIQQVEDALSAFRPAVDAPVPAGGWVRAIRESLGMTHAQLAARMGGRTPQTIEAMQRSEAAGSIQLDTLRQLAEAMGCKLVYAIVPSQPINAVLHDRAQTLARQTMKGTTHTMRLEAQDLAPEAQQRALDRERDRLLAGNPRRLWDQI